MILRFRLRICLDGTGEIGYEVSRTDKCGAR